MLIRRTLMLAIAALAAVPAQALATPSSTQYEATLASLRDGPDDVLLSDGFALLSGRELAARVVDFSDPATPDRFHFQPGHGRFVQISHSSIEGGNPVPCKFTFIVFTSTTTPNWFEAIRDGSQSSVLSDAYFTCNADSVGNTGRKFLVEYPDGSDECAVIEGAHLNYLFTVPAGCPATVTTRVKHRGQTTVTELTGASAPMEIHASFFEDGL